MILNNQGYRDNYYGSILDPLHGDIKLSEIEKHCISHPLFSRLRYVKQNTFLYYVFPSANHTRFEHSIGVMHLAGKIFDACKENYATGQKKKEKYAIHGSSFFDLNSLKEREEVYYQELRIAALLHDVGHGPMSHLFDQFAISKDKFLQKVSIDRVLKQYITPFTELIHENKGKVEHEAISCAFIFLILDELKINAIEDPERFSDSARAMIDKINPERIVSLIEPVFKATISFLDEHENDYSEFFSRIVSAFPIDADRMDYLLRDSYFSGVTYGIYDINRTFASFLSTVNDRKVSLAFKESGLDSMLRFIQSRSHLYNQVYFHKTNRAANTMLTYGTSTNRQQKRFKLLDECKDFTELADFYVNNSDEFFIRTTVKNKVAEVNFEKEVIAELVNRRLFKRVFQAKIVLTDKDAGKQEIVKNLQDQIDSKLLSLQAQKIYAVTDKYENKAFKDSDRKVLLIAQKKDSKYIFSKDWKTIGKEFALADITVLMVRIYLRRTFKNSAEYEEMKKSILDTVAMETKALKELTELM